MGSDGATDSGNGRDGTRPARASLAEIGVFSAVAVSIAFIPPSISSEDGDVVLSLGWTAGAAESVLGHIGWGFGVYVPVMLGLYAIVVGGQITESEKEGVIRRRLAITAELMTAALSPALILVAVSIVAGPVDLGPLFVIGPAAGLVLFLAVQLGNFIVFDDRHRLEAAQRSRGQALAQLRRMNRRSRRPPWLVLLANIAAGALAGLIPVVLFSPRSLVLPSFALNVFVAIVLALASFAAAPARYGSVDRASYVSFCVLAVFAHLLMAMTAVAVVATDEGYLGTGLGISAVMAVTATSTVASRASARTFVRDWSLNGAAAAAVAHSAVRTLRRAVRDIRELTPRPAVPPPAPTSASFADRLRAAVATFKESSRVPPRLSRVGPDAADDTGGTGR